MGLSEIERLVYTRAVELMVRDIARELCGLLPRGYVELGFGAVKIDGLRERS